MKPLLTILFLLGGLSLSIIGCRDAEPKKGQRTLGFSGQALVSPENKKQAISMTDSRDGETYPIIGIGKQVWMAENLRYNAEGSIVNPDNPSLAYGRLYDGITAQTVCPDGWHLPSDGEWNEMEMTLGMPAADTAKTFWRGTHGKKMKSTFGWGGAGNGTNNSGFNGLPAGYYFPDSEEGGFSLGGLGTSGGYWSSAEESSVWIRFLGAPLEGVNRMEDKKSSGSALACRCVKD